MNKFLSIILLSILSFSIALSTDNISFEKFNQWAESISIDDYELSETYTEPDYNHTGNEVFVAAYKSNDNASIIISLSNIEKFESIENMTNKSTGKLINIENLECAFVPMGDGPNYIIGAVKLTRLKATMELMIIPAIEEKAFRRLISDLNITDLK